MNIVDGVEYCDVCDYWAGVHGCVNGICRKPAPAPQPPADARAAMHCNTCGGRCDGPCEEGDEQFAAEQTPAEQAPTMVAARDMFKACPSLNAPANAVPESAEQLRARLGWPPLPQAQKRANLEYNLSALGGAPAAPPVTGDGDAAAKVAKYWSAATREIPLPGWRMKQEAVNKMIDIGMEGCSKEAYAAGLARGRALGVREDATEKLLDDAIVWIKHLRCSDELDRIESDDLDAFIATIARRAGRGTL